MLVVLLPAAAAAQPSASSATPPPATPTARHETGPLLELRYTTGDSAQITNFSFPLPPEKLPDPHTALFAGYQLSRVSFGVGFELGRAKEVSEFTGGGSSGNEVTSYMLLPGLRAAVGHSSDGRAEVLALVDIGWGETHFSSMDAFVNPVTMDRFRFQIGPGLRCWLAGSFAVGAAVLVRHDRVTVRDDSQGFTDTSSRTDLAMSLSVTGVF